jgi:hypothetical protein
MHTTVDPNGEIRGQIERTAHQPPARGSKEGQTEGTTLAFGRPERSLNDRLTNEVSKQRSVHQ